MASRVGLRAGLLATGLAICGALANAAWRDGMWGGLAGSILLGTWIGISLWMQLRRADPVSERLPPIESREVPIHRFLLDAVPTPMLTIDQDCARAINRAARTLFSTDDRIVPPPSALFDTSTAYLRHEGRSWRIDRVEIAGAARRMVLALIDVEREERAAEARASAELIQVLGHELMNGLAPMASLAESGLDALEAEPGNTALLRNILGTISRHAEGLQRFAEAYRALARLPEPQLTPVRMSELLGDLARLFGGRWPQVTLTITVPDTALVSIDRDQISQALWAILQNAAEASLASDLAKPEVRLTVQDNGKTIAIDICDNGRGMEPERALHVFKPFYTTKVNGTGIGLSLARQIAHAHGGTLVVESCLPATIRLGLPKDLA